MLFKTTATQLVSILIFISTLFSIILSSDLTPKAAAQDISAKMVGGEFAPSLAGGRVAYISTPNYSCSGVLVGRRSVLTAAHCVATGPTTDQYGIYVGEEWHTVESLWYHRRYNPSKNAYDSSPYDLGMIILNEAVTSVTPMPIVSGKPLRRGATIAIAGYGTNELSGDPNRSFIDNFKIGFSRIVRTDGKRLIATHSSFQASTCPGDSGGPATAQYRRNTFGLVGIISAGINTETEGGCQLNDDGSFIHVDLQSASSKAFLKAFPGLKYVR